MIGREAELEPLNRQALAIAKQVAAETGHAARGRHLEHERLRRRATPSRPRAVRAMFEEQVGWAAEAGVDFVIAETISWGNEALIALEAIKQAGLPAVVTLAVHTGGRTRSRAGRSGRRASGSRTPAPTSSASTASAARATMLPVLAEIRAAVSCHVAALPVPFRTTEAEPTFSGAQRPRLSRTCPAGATSRSRSSRSRATATRSPTSAGRRYALGVRYLGVCCGAGPHHIRALAEALGRTPPASRYSAGHVEALVLRRGGHGAGGVPGIRQEVVGADLIRPGAP